MNKPAPTRRTLVHGIAWSIPAATIAATAPAFAASGFNCDIIVCKTQNSQDNNKWDFKCYVRNVVKGTPTIVYINGRVATLVPAQGNRSAYWVLRKQAHSWSATFKVVDEVSNEIDFGVRLFNGSCPL